VLFLGDSITEDGEWAEWFPELACLNRGVGGDTVEGVRRRLAWTVNEPVAISLLIGTNDLSGAGETTDPRGIAAQTRRLLEELRTAAPNAPIFVNGVMPRTTARREEIQELNRHYRQLAKDGGATYVDVWPVLADENGALRREMTYDQLHLTGAGYVAWTNILRPLLLPFSRR